MERCGDPVQAQVQQSRGFKKKILVSSEYFVDFSTTVTTTVGIIYRPNSLLVKKSESISLIFFFFQRSQFLSSVKNLYATLHTLTVNISMGFCFSDHTEYSISEKY